MRTPQQPNERRYPDQVALTASKWIFDHLPWPRGAGSDLDLAFTLAELTTVAEDDVCAQHAGPAPPLWIAFAWHLSGIRLDERSSVPEVGELPADILALPEQVQSAVLDLLPVYEADPVQRTAQPSLPQIIERANAQVQTTMAAKDLKPAGRVVDPEALAELL